MADENFDENPYSALDEDMSERERALYSDEEDAESDYSYDAEAEWEESKQQINALFSLVIFPFVGKWLGRKVSFWVWSRFATFKQPFSVRYSILPADMVEAIKHLA